MAKPDTEEFFNVDNYRSPIKDRLSESELVTLDSELLNFIEKKTLTNMFKGREIKVIDKIAWLKSKGALTKNSAVIIKNYKAAEYNASGKRTKALDCKPIFYEQCEADYEQWLKWKGKGKFIQQKQIEGLEEVAQGMKIDF